MLREMAAKPAKSNDILDAVALLVVDMQSSILGVIPDSAAAIERCGLAIEAARLFGLRIVFTEQVPDKLGPTDPRLRALAPQARVFAKNSFSALQAEGLIDHLRRQGIYHLLIAGIEIPVCIYQTALHAVDSDFDVTVLSDAVAGRRLEDNIVVLEALTRAHCHLLPTETVYYSMLGRSAHPLFHNFNNLIKRYAQPGGLDAAPPPAEPAEPRRERRPVLVAPEDQAESSREEFATEREREPDLASTEGEFEDENEPSVGRAEDGAPVNAPSADYTRTEDQDEDADVGAVREQSAEGISDEESAESADDEATGEEGEEREGGEPGRRRRGRRRRGGARRRRARERREAATGTAPHEPSQPTNGDSSSASARERDTRSEADQPDSPAERDVASDESARE